MDYSEGKAYREALRSSGRKSSTPAAGESPSFPVGLHSQSATPHKETVGWMNDTFTHPTHPNSGKHGNNTDASSHDPYRHYKNTDLSEEKMGKDGGVNT